MSYQAVIRMRDYDNKPPHIRRIEAEYGMSIASRVIDRYPKSSENCLRQKCEALRLQEQISRIG